MSVSLLKEVITNDLERESSYSQPGNERSYAKVMGIRLRQDYSERLSAISHFSMEIAHHLNNSLTPIICYAQLLSQGSASPEQKKRLEKITEAAHHAKEIIDGLLSFAGGQPTQILPVELNIVVRETIDLAEGLLWLPSRQVVFDASPELPTLLGDPNQISQMLLHLLKNAMQATDPMTRRIEVRTYVDVNGRIVLEVEDNGTGIASEILPKVLLPFFTTRDGEGVGLGLSIVNGIAEAHGAHLEIQTGEGQGTIILISFPPVAENLPD